MGVPGETSTTIAARQGALKIQISEPVTIPASGSVDIKFKASDGGVVTPRVANIAGWQSCSINGVEGRLSVVINDGADVWPRVLSKATFTRTAPGESVSVAVGDELIPQGHSVKADINIILSGSNGGWTPENKVLDDSLNNDADISALVQLLKKQGELSNNPDKYIIIGLVKYTDERLAKYKAALSSAFGDKFFDLKSLLQDANLLRSYGVELTAEDLQQIANKTVPDTLHVSDKVHFTDKGYEIIADLVYKKLQDMGYIR